MLKYETHGADAKVGEYRYLQLFEQLDCDVVIDVSSFSVCVDLCY